MVIPTVPAVELGYFRLDPGPTKVYLLLNEELPKPRIYQTVLRDVWPVEPDRDGIYG